MTEQTLRSRLWDYVGKMRDGFAPAAQVDHKIVPGVGNPYGQGTMLPTDEAALRKIRSEEALYGRVAARLGPVANFVSTHPLRGLTPERVGAIFNTVLVSGWMLDKACLDEDVILADSHWRSVDESFRVAIVGSPFTVEPVDSSDLAQAVADYQQKVLDECDGWQQACKRLLYGDHAGYAIEEVIYENREITFQSGGKSYTVEAPVPVGFEWVRNAHTRWNLAEGDRLELDAGQGGFVPVSAAPHKWLCYEAAHDFMVRRRGYNYTNVWLSMIKLNAWARWAAVLEIWGLRNPVVKYERDRWQDDKFKAEIISMLQAWATGKGAALPDDVDIEPSPGVTDGDARGMHAALLGTINAEQSKLRQGEQLTTEAGHSGTSYALSKTHADTKAEHIEAGEQNLASCVRRWMRQALRMSCEQYVSSGAGAVLPRGLCAALGATPQQILSKCGRPQWRVTREMTPSVRMKLYDDGVNKLGLEIDAEQPYREFGFAKARGNNKLRGQREVLGPQDISVGGVNSDTTAENPAEKGTQDGRTE